MGQYISKFYSYSEPIDNYNLILHPIPEVQQPRDILKRKQKKSVDDKMKSVV